MYPAVAIVVKTVVFAGVLGGGIAMLKGKGLKDVFDKVKGLIPGLGGNDLDEAPSSRREDDGLTARRGAPADDDRAKRLAAAAERALQLEKQVKELRAEILKKDADLEVLARKLNDARQLDVDYFLELLTWLQKMLGKPVREETAGDIAELVSILSTYGLTVDRDYEPGREGFICIKDMEVATPEVSLPMIVRNDNIVLEGIVKVPMSFAGAEPPAEQVATERCDDGGSYTGAGEGSATPEEAEPVSENGDDFIVG